MIGILLICTLVTIGQDSTPPAQPEVTKSYTKQVLINTFVGLGFTVSAGIFYKKGNTAYEEYEESETMKSALENWDNVELYDNMRNVCALGALVFLGRAIYYQLKNVRVSSSTHSLQEEQDFRPMIDFVYTNQPRVIIGVVKNL